MFYGVWVMIRAHGVKELQLDVGKGLVWNAMIPYISNHVDIEHDFWERRVDTSIGKLLFVQRWDLTISLQIHFAPNLTTVLCFGDGLIVAINPPLTLRK